ncbi:MAG: hypothetical protein HY711_01505 [Candidatus Melainabacteria bacterium]|nr:hypothetical protein [Candidatus Melainabacteria bacterium]
MGDSQVPAKDSRVGAEGTKAELLQQLRDLSSTIREIHQVVEKPQPSLDALPRVVKDKRGRAVEVWDQLGRQYSFFFARDCAHPYAYEIRDNQRLAIERGSVVGTSKSWAIYCNEQGLPEIASAGDALHHQVVRVEVTSEGVMLASASDGYQLRRDPSGDEFEAVYDSRGCLVEATRRGKSGVDRTTWNYDGDGNTVATEYKPDGAVIKSKYDSLGRLLCRAEEQSGLQSLATVKYHQDGSYLVARQDGTVLVTEELRRRDGTLERCKTTNHVTQELSVKSYDNRERLVRQETCNNHGSEVTIWQYGEDGWTEVSQNSSDGKSLHVRYDKWGRLVLQQETTPDAATVTMFAYKADNSYHVRRKTSQGIETDEYYRPDGSRQHSSARTADGQLVEVDYDSSGRPLRRTTSTVRRYQV